MPRQARSETEPMMALRKFAMRFQGTEEGIACEGTSLEKRTVKVKGEAFVFLGRSDAMVKLRESLAEAARLAAKEPGRLQVGGHGWVKVTYGADGSAPIEVLERWIEESYRLFAPAGGAKKKAKKRRPS